uniref:60S ribosomal protein L18a, plant n=1 Tax=Solanum tuberosum TaxID=4113 RepID=M1AEZ9_SOLTU
MSKEDGKNRASSATGEPLPANYYYGTFQGVANHPPPPPQSHQVFGFPQPVPPPGAAGAPPQYYPHGYQTVHVLTDIQESWGLKPYVHIFNLLILIVDLYPSNVQFNYSSI